MVCWKFYTDQGLQFTSLEFTQTLKDAGVTISMDGKDRWMDKVFIERLWRSVKWECVYLRELETGSHARQALGDWFRFCNEQRPHTAFDGRRPMDVYGDGHSAPKAA
jgi:putative transposase